jgi:hypothetical protein
MAGSSAGVMRREGMRSIRRHFLDSRLGADAIDDEHVVRSITSLEFQPELFLKRGEN